MTDERSPIFVVATGETAITATGARPSYHHFQLRWGVEERPGGVYLKTLVHTTKYPGSTDELDTVLRLYSEDGAVVERDARDKGEVRKIADQFEQNATAIEAGTPLAVLNLNPAQVSAIKAKGVHTVEALRDVPDNVLAGLGSGARVMRQRAVDFLETKDRTAGVAKLQAENENLQEQVKALEEALNEMRAEIRATRSTKKG